MKQRTLNALLAGLAGLSFSGGIIATIWTWDWRYAVTGVLLMFVIALLAGQLQMNRNQ